VQKKLEVHRLSADNRPISIIGQFADNRYWPFDRQSASADYRHRPIICFSKRNNKKCF